VAGGGPRLLPGEGNVGTYRDLIKAGSPGDNLTPNHIPSANRMALENISKGDGISINMQQPVPGVGGRHRATFTYGTQADIGMTPRGALAAGVWDARGIYRADGLYTPQIRSSLQELILLNKTNHPTIFVKPTK
jgi:filamentous hemagglutinin